MNCDEAFRHAIMARLEAFALLETEIGEARAAAVARSSVPATGVPSGRSGQT